MYEKIKKSSFVILFLLLGISCNDDIILCEQSTQVKLEISFFHYQQNAPANDTLLPLLTVLGIGASDTLVRPIPAQSIQVPLNQNRDSSSFAFEPSSLNNSDTITLRYKRKLVLLSPGCGFVNFFQLDTLIFTHHNIDSTAIIDPSVTNTNAQNIAIYFN